MIEKSMFCLGTVQFGMKYGVNNALGRQPDKQESYRIIEKALQSGIVKFDTASVYGTAEALLGNFPWGGYVPQIISKLPPECDDDVTSVMEEIKKSLARLQSAKLYGYMLHRAGDMEKSSVMNGLMTGKMLGLVEKIGVSIYEPEEALKAVNDSRIDIIQIPYNVLDKRLDKVEFFVMARKNNKEIYARSPFLQGLLLMDPEDAEFRVANSGKWVAEFQKISSEHGFTPAETAMLYSLKTDGIDYVVFGVDTIEQLCDNLAIQEKIDVFDDCYKVLKNMFMEVPREIVVPSLWR